MGPGDGIRHPGAGARDDGGADNGGANDDLPNGALAARITRCPKTGVSWSHAFHS